MRIAVVNNFFPPRVGGSSHLSEALAHGYAAAGHDVLVVTAAYRDAPPTEVPPRGYRVERVPAASLPRFGLSIDFDITFTLRPGVSRRVGSILDRFAPDVVHQHGQFLDLSWITGRWARRNGVPVLLSVHTRLENPNRTYALGFAALDYLVVRPLLAGYDPFMVVMDRKMDAYIRSRYRTGEDRFVDIPVGVDPGSLAKGDGARVREALGLGDRPVLLSLGHVIPLRDRVALVEALPAVLARHPDLAVVVVGTVHYPAFLERAEELGVSDAILAVGAVPKAEVADHLASAQIESHDLDGHGLGTASLEAMAAGVPVVAAVRSDNFRGVELKDGENIFLVSEGRPAELADAICRVLDDPDAARLVAKREQELVERHFTLEAVTGQHLDAFERMTATSSRPDPGQNP